MSEANETRGERRLAAAVWLSALRDAESGNAELRAGAEEFLYDRARAAERQWWAETAGLAFEPVEALLRAWQAEGVGKLAA